MTDETREQDLVGKYFGANRNADDRTMKQACERLKSDAYSQGLTEGRRQAVEEAMRLIANLGPVMHRYIHQLGEKPGSTGVIIGVHLDDAVLDKLNVK